VAAAEEESPVSAALEEDESSVPPQAVRLSSMAPARTDERMALRFFMVISS